MSEYRHMVDPASVRVLIDASVRVLIDRVNAAEAEVKRLREGIEALADWHETKAEKARRFRPEINGENVIMDKAATVHDDAATRLRVLLDGGE